MPSSSQIAVLPIAEPVNRQILFSSREQFRKAHPSVSGQLYDKVVVGAATFQYPKQGGPSLLLLKRSADEKYFPDVFELPGGKVEDPPIDHTIQDAVIREIHEETGLRITAILAELEPMIYTTEKKTADDANQHILVSSPAIQLNYVVSVADCDVKLSKEHSESSWVAENELGGFSMTKEMEILVQHAFAWAANQTSVVDVIA